MYTLTYKTSLLIKQAYMYKLTYKTSLHVYTYL